MRPSSSPLAVLIHSVELARLQMSESVLVMGAGPIGVLGVAIAKIAGASRVIVADRVEHRLAAACEAGADAAVNIDREPVRDAVMDLTHGLGVHVAFDAAGKPDSINTALGCLRFGGRLVIIGIPSQQLVGVDLWKAMHQEVSIHVQKRSNANDHEALDMLARGQIDTSQFVTHRIPLKGWREEPLKPSLTTPTAWSRLSWNCSRSGYAAFLTAPESASLRISIAFLR